MRLSWLLFVALVQALLVPVAAPAVGAARAALVLATSTTLVAGEVTEARPAARRHAGPSAAGERFAPAAVARGEERPTRRAPRARHGGAPFAARVLALAPARRLAPRGGDPLRSRRPSGPEPRPPRA